MEAFVVRHILPKLAYCLQTMSINPQHQDIGMRPAHTHTHTHAREVEQCKKHLLRYVFAGPFEWVMTWRDMLPAHHYGSMLDQHLFPKWIQVHIS